MDSSVEGARRSWLRTSGEASVAAKDAQLRCRRWRVRMQSKGGRRGKVEGNGTGRGIGWAEGVGIQCFGCSDSRNPLPPTPRLYPFLQEKTRPDRGTNQYRTVWNCARFVAEGSRVRFEDDLRTKISWIYPLDFLYCTEYFLAVVQRMKQCKERAKDESGA